jgi:hypothetical protein
MSLDLVSVAPKGNTPTFISTLPLLPQTGDYRDLARWLLELEGWARDRGDLWFALSVSTALHKFDVLLQRLEDRNREIRDLQDEMSVL